MIPVKKNSETIIEVKQNHPKYKLPITKRIFDITVSSIALILLSPLLLLVVLMIRLESKGPVIYSSKRVGTGYKIFNFLKFRSMYPNAEDRLKDLIKSNQYSTQETLSDSKNYSIPYDEIKDFSDDQLLFGDDGAVSSKQYLEKIRAESETAFLKFKNDPRITVTGRFIRNTSIDELPQLINVLKGDMSIVGNRPLPLYEAEKLTEDEWIGRFMAPAGLTGLWQVEKRAQSAEMSPEERKMLDVEYARNHSFWKDIKILFRTIPALLQSENV